MSGNGFELKLGQRKRKGQTLRVVEIVYTPSPDADDRLRRALDILLAAADVGRDAEHDSAREKGQDTML